MKVVEVRLGGGALEELGWGRGGREAVAGRELEVGKRDVGRGRVEGSGRSDLRWARMSVGVGGVWAEREAGETELGPEMECDLSAW